MTAVDGRALLVVGDVVTDVLARHRTPLAPATDTAARIVTLPGGAGANVACWAAHSGVQDVRLLARVGADAADPHERALRAAGVRPHLVVDPEAPTGTVICLVGADGERTFLTDSGAVLRLSAADWSDGLLAGAGHLHVSGYLLFADTSRASARLAMAAARARSVPVSVDPASAGFIARFGVDRFLTAVEGADVLLPNHDEAALLTGLPDPADAAAKLSRHFPLVVCTQGPRGALVAASGTIVAKVPAEPATAVDTTGAGDAFTGAFLAARLAGHAPVTAARHGCRAGARAAAHIGARPQSP
ncbi:carbohydrate kinase family protein [Streptomyces griseocarneus]|uniref:carbohydrate kinase family protein n=1 Tax=Streptomyces griseocarneus TaxID=51201 RepID=UPI00167C9551|nr:PfkB family carbohydrate kinase [Streptomyces griseocarneus]MBZ6477954.1 PfkB family carbohydrate kinase [Streptomyces griseocarneus]GHG54464.1 sugar kinase [Streptomyces griseocarneus]